MICQPMLKLTTQELFLNQMFAVSFHLHFFFGNTLTSNNILGGFVSGNLMLYLFFLLWYVSVSPKKKKIQQTTNFNPSLVCALCFFLIKVFIYTPSMKDNSKTIYFSNFYLSDKKKSKVSFENGFYFNFIFQSIGNIKLNQRLFITSHYMYLYNQRLSGVYYLLGRRLVCTILTR